MYFGDAELSNDDSNSGHSIHCKAVLSFLDVNNSTPGEDFTEPPFLKDFFRAARERRRQEKGGGKCQGVLCSKFLTAVKKISS